MVGCVFLGLAAVQAFAVLPPNVPAIRRDLAIDMAAPSTLRADMRVVPVVHEASAPLTVALVTDLLNKDVHLATVSPASAARPQASIAMIAASPFRNADVRP